MSNWNPRPMYASQPAIDPQDDRRIYQLNSYSFSDNGGETFTAPRTTTHGDDRFVWVDPKDSRHLVKLDDGGIGIWYDRGLKFLLRDLAAGVAVLSRRRGQRRAVQRLRRPAGQRLLARPERELVQRRHSQSGVGSPLRRRWLLCRPRAEQSAQCLRVVAVPRARAQRHPHVAERDDPAGRSDRRHRGSTQLEHVGQRRPRRGARQRDAPRQLGRAAADLSA